MCSTLPETSAHLLFLSVEYGDGDPEIYLVPISVAIGEKAEAILRDHPRCRCWPGWTDCPAGDHGRPLRSNLRSRLQRLSAAGHRAPAAHPRRIRRAGRRAHARIPQGVDFGHVESGAHPAADRRSAFTVINYGSDFVLKLYRKLEEGINPGREVPEFLCEQTSFKRCSARAGLAGLSPLSCDGRCCETCIGTLSSSGAERE